VEGGGAGPCLALEIAEGVMVLGYPRPMTRE